LATNPLIKNIEKPTDKQVFDGLLGGLAYMQGRLRLMKLVAFVKEP